MPFNHNLKAQMKLLYKVLRNSFNTMKTNLIYWLKLHVHNMLSSSYYPLMYICQAPFIHCQFVLKGVCQKQYVLSTDIHKVNWPNSYLKTLVHHRTSNLLVSNFLIHQLLHDYSFFLLSQTDKLLKSLIFHSFLSFIGAVFCFEARQFIISWFVKICTYSFF